MRAVAMVLILGSCSTFTGPPSAHSDHTELWPACLNPCCKWIQLLVHMHKCRCLHGNEMCKLLLESVEISWAPSLGCKDLFIWPNPDALFKASDLFSGLLEQCWIFVCLNMGVQCHLKCPGVSPALYCESMNLSTHLPSMLYVCEASEIHWCDLAHSALHASYYLDNYVMCV